MFEDFLENCAMQDEVKLSDERKSLCRASLLSIIKKEDVMQNDLNENLNDSAQDDIDFCEPAPRVIKPSAKKRKMGFFVPAAAAALICATALPFGINAAMNGIFAGAASSGDASEGVVLDLTAPAEDAYKPFYSFFKDRAKLHATDASVIPDLSEYVIPLDMTGSDNGVTITLHNALSFGRFTIISWTGELDPEIYGDKTFKDIEAALVPRYIGGGSSSGAEDGYDDSITFDGCFISIIYTSQRYFSDNFNENVDTLDIEFLTSPGNPSADIYFTIPYNRNNDKSIIQDTDVSSKDITINSVKITPIGLELTFTTSNENYTPFFRTIYHLKDGNTVEQYVHYGFGTYIDGVLTDKYISCVTNNVAIDPEEVAYIEFWDQKDQESVRVDINNSADSEVTSFSYDKKPLSDNTLLFNGASYDIDNINNFDKTFAAQGLSIIKNENGKLTLAPCGEDPDIYYFMFELPKSVDEKALAYSWDKNGNIRLYLGESAENADENTVAVGDALGMRYSEDCYLMNWVDGLSSHDTDIYKLGFGGCFSLVGDEGSDRYYIKRWYPASDKGFEAVKSYPWDDIFDTGDGNFIHYNTNDMNKLEEVRKNTYGIEVAPTEPHFSIDQ